MKRAVVGSWLLVGLFVSMVLPAPLAGADDHWHPRVAEAAPNLIRPGTELNGRATQEAMSVWFLGDGPDPVPAYVQSESGGGRRTVAVAQAGPELQVVNVVVPQGIPLRVTSEGPVWTGMVAHRDLNELGGRTTRLGCVDRVSATLWSVDAVEEVTVDADAAAGPWYVFAPRHGLVWDSENDGRHGTWRPQISPDLIVVVQEPADGGCAGGVRLSAAFPAEPDFQLEVVGVLATLVLLGSGVGILAYLWWLDRFRG